MLRIENIEVRGYNFGEGMKAVGATIFPAGDWGNVDPNQVEMNENGKENIIIHAKEGMDKRITNVQDATYSAEKVFKAEGGSPILKVGEGSLNKESFKIYYLNSNGQIVAQRNLTKKQYLERLNRLNEMLKDEEEDEKSK